MQISVSNEFYNENIELKFNPELKPSNPDSFNKERIMIEEGEALGRILYEKIPALTVKYALERLFRQMKRRNPTILTTDDVLRILS